MTTGEKIRDLKRPYRKKSFQSGYSQKGSAVQSNPPPISSYSTVSTAATQVARPGVDPQTFRRPVRATPQAGLEGIPIDFSNYPWHMVSKGNSANLIQRQRIDFTTLDTYDAAGVIVTANSFNNNSYVDMVVINVADVSGDDTWRDSDGNGVLDEVVARSDYTAARSPNIPPQTYTGIEATTSASTSRFPMGSGSSATSVGGTVSVGSTGELYVVGSFGHSEPSTATIPTSGMYYELWVDGNIFLQWQDFQWAPTSPKTDMWDFDVPIITEKQIVLRVINRTGLAITTGNMDACFAGWTEVQDGYDDTSRAKLQS
jgi:hypothetical protein|tara:strand:- start:396 stop:1340 length:945 start_codon:yes stop_codon:yes gene_type:complete